MCLTVSNRTTITSVIGVSKKTPTGLYKNVSEGILKPCSLQYSLCVIQQQTVGNLTFITVIYTFGYQTFKLAHNFPVYSTWKRLHIPAAISGKQQNYNIKTFV
jgi:hypothetical protein